MFVPFYGPATHAGQQQTDRVRSLVAASGYEELVVAQGGKKLERSLKASRIFTISLLSINIEISRRASPAKSKTERIEQAYHHNKIERQLDHDASAAFARMLQRG